MLKMLADWKNRNLRSRAQHQIFHLSSCFKPKEGNYESFARYAYTYLSSVEGICRVVWPHQKYIFKKCFDENLEFCKNQYYSAICMDAIAHFYDLLSMHLSKYGSIDLDTFYGMVEYCRMIHITSEMRVM